LVDRPILPITDIRIVGKRIKELLGLGGLRRKRGAAAGATGPVALQYPNCYEAVGIGRTEEEERGGGCSYSTRGYCSCERARGPAARAVRGAGNAGRRASPTAGKREGFSF
jgi:hypothetical protein